jgi:hypothetical protein
MQLHPPRELTYCRLLRGSSLIKLALHAHLGGCFMALLSLSIDRFLVNFYEKADFAGWARSRG